MKISVIIAAILITIILFFAYQLYSKNGDGKMISYNVEITHPYSELRVEFVSDTIFTVEGRLAHIPYGGTSSDWGNSNVFFTEQYGTPKQVKIIYYSLYEDLFYDLDIDLPVERMKDLMDRVYAINESTHNNSEMKEFIRLSEYPNYEEEFNRYNHSYSAVSDFVLGFSPKGIVTIWLRYTKVQKLIGQYKASPIEKDEKVAEEFFSQMAVGRKEGKELFYLNEEIPDIWSDYLYSSKWKIEPNVANEHLRVLEIDISYFNKEYERLLRQWLLEDKIKERGIPKNIIVTWESAKDEGYYASIFYDWETTLSTFKKSERIEDKSFKFSIGEDNKTIKTYLGNQEVTYDSIQIFKSDQLYRDSY